MPVSLNSNPSPWWVPLGTRVDEPEIMDHQECTDAQMLEALRFLRMTNHYFGGHSTVLKHFENFSRSWKKGETIRILDVGTGLADLPQAISKWARSRGFRVQITAIDSVPQIVRLARPSVRHDPDISVVEQDLFNYPEGRFFDYVTASLFLHHIPPADSKRAILKLDRLARRGLVLSDLLRSRPSYWSVKILSHLFGNAIVRNDGPLSVRRAFTVAEVSDLARESGLSYLEAKPEAFFRISLAGEKIEASLEKTL